MESIARIAGTVGALRLMLQGLALLLAAAAPFSGGPVSYTGWAIVPSLVIPAIVPIVFFGMLLEILMSWVFRIDAAGAERQRFSTILRLDLVALALLVLAWGPFFASLGSAA